MLQLPQRSLSKFSKVDLDDIVRGGVTVKRRSKPRKPKADPVIQLLARYRRAVDQYAAVRADLKNFYATHATEDVRPATVYLPAYALMMIHGSIQNREFSNENRITYWANEGRAYYRSILRGRPKDHAAKATSRAHARKYIEDIDKMEPDLKRALRQRERIVKKRWKESGYQALLDRRERSFAALIRVRNILCDTKPVSFSGVSAILALLQQQAWDEVGSTYITTAMPPAARKRVLASMEKAITRLAAEASK